MYIYRSVLLASEELYDIITQIGSLDRIANDSII